MLSTVIFSTIAYLIVITILISRRVEPQHYQKLKEDYLMFKLKTVYEYYPQLAGLSCWEIVEKYDLDELYNNITVKLR